MRGKLITELQSVTCHMDHTVLPAMWHKWTPPHLNRSQTHRYSINLLRRDEMMSWPLDSNPTRRRTHNFLMISLVASVS